MLIILVLGIFFVGGGCCGSLVLTLFFFYFASFWNYLYIGLPFGRRIKQSVHTYNSSAGWKWLHVWVPDCVVRVWTIFCRSLQPVLLFVMWGKEAPIHMSPWSQVSVPCSWMHSKRKQLTCFQVGKNTKEIKQQLSGSVGPQQIIVVHLSLGFTIKFYSCAV